MTRKPPTTLVPTSSARTLARRQDLHKAVLDYAASSEAPNTRRARESDWRVFAAWCAVEEVSCTPTTPEVLAAFLSDQSRIGKAVATVMRYARSIQAVHLLNGQPSPMDRRVGKVLMGIRRQRGTQQKRKEALTASMIASALDTYEAARKGKPLTVLRDRVIILLGLATAMRRGELCAIDVEDIHRVDGGIVIDLKRSKTDQEGRGRPVAVHRLDDGFDSFCPVRAVETWLEATHRTSGPLLSGLKRNGELRTTRLTEQYVNTVVKEVAMAGGFNPDLFGAHSLRAGYVTTARQQGVDWGSIMEQTGHRRLETAKLYTRFSPDVFIATRVADVFRGAFVKKGDLK